MAEAVGNEIREVAEITQAPLESVQHGLGGLQHHIGEFQQGGMESGVNHLVTSARGELGDMKHLAHDAIASKAYLYPFKVRRTSASK